MWAVQRTYLGDLEQEYISTLPLAPTLITAAQAIMGMPHGEITIRRHGNMVAWLHTNWRGDLDAVEIYSPTSCVVTSINPKWSRFNA